MNETNEKISEILEFFEDSTSWDREGLVNDILHEMAVLKDISPDEVMLEHEGYLTDLERFANDFFLRTLDKVVLAIKSFED